jgi:hypothetical protein
MSCLQAYETLSNQLIEAEGELGLEEAVECFPYASLTTFLDQEARRTSYFMGRCCAAEIMRKHGGDIGGTNNGERKRAAKHLASALR